MASRKTRSAEDVQASGEEGFAPTFTPTMEEFKDFSTYVQKLYSQCTTGICKVVPPPGWRDQLQYTKKDIDNFHITTPIRQYVSGNKGVYQLMLVEDNELNVGRFKDVAEQEKMEKARSAKYDESHDTVERLFWKNIRFNPPMYGADVQGSLFPMDTKKMPWNVRDLGSILTGVLPNHVFTLPGVNSPMLYWGMWKAMFAWHVEDMNLFSINYLHLGAPKSWYALSARDGPKLERLAQGFFPELARQCPEFLRHKTTMISPTVLAQNNIPYSRAVQREGEFIITFPYAYHAGFNYGFNCAESVNFALESWIDHGRRAKSCQCRTDSVRINMDIFIERYDALKEGRLEALDSEQQAEQYIEGEEHVSDDNADVREAPEPASHKRPERRAKQAGRSFIEGIGRSMTGLSAEEPEEEPAERPRKRAKAEQPLSAPTPAEPPAQPQPNTSEPAKPTSIVADTSAHKQAKKMQRATEEEKRVLLEHAKHGIPDRDTRTRVATLLCWADTSVYQWYYRHFQHRKVPQHEPKCSERTGYRQRLQRTACTMRVPTTAARLSTLKKPVTTATTTTPSLLISGGRRAMAPAAAPPQLKMALPPAAPFPLSNTPMNLPRLPFQYLVPTARVPSAIVSLPIAPPSAQKPLLPWFSHPPNGQHQHARHPFFPFGGITFLPTLRQQPTTAPSGQHPSQQLSAAVPSAGPVGQHPLAVPRATTA